MMTRLKLSKRRWLFVKQLLPTLKHRVVHGRKPGRCTVFTTEEEEPLRNYLFFMAERGFPLTRRMVMAYEWAVVKNASWQGKFNQDTGPGDRWLSNFRSTTLMSCYWSFTSLTAQIYDPEEFWTVKKTLTDNSLTNSPRCIYTTATNYFYHSREKPVTSVKSKCAYIYDQVKLQSTLRYCVVLQ